MTRIRWEPYCWPEARPLSSGRLHAFAASRGIAFPKDFTDCILENQGMTPTPCEFPFGDGYSTVLNNLLHFEDAPKSDSVSFQQESLETSDAPAGLIVFAIDPAGSPICFDFRRDAGVPSVVIFDHEQNADEPVFIASGFTAFLALLR